MIEVDFVTGFQANSERSPESFDTSTGIDRQLRVAIIDRVKRSNEPLAGTLIRAAEADDPDFSGCERFEMPAAGLEFRTEQSMQDSRLGANRREAASVLNIVGKGLLEVVGHFRFQLHVLGDVKSRASAQPEEIHVNVVPVQSKVVCEGSYFDVLISLLRPDHKRSHKSEHQSNRHQDTSHDHLLFGFAPLRKPLQ